MRVTKWLCVPVVLCAFVVASGQAVAQHHEHEQGEMSAEQMAMQEAWMKAMATGEEHAWLASRAGTWTATVKMWMSPDGEPEITEGTVERTMLLGGRVLQESYAGTFQGEPFEGIGMTGFDNVTGKYWSTWCDNMSTGLFRNDGGRDEEGRMVMMGTSSDPMTGGMIESKWITTEESADREVHEAWQSHEGEMIRTMEITYVRQ